jgi:hypothetical protein
MFLLGIVVAYRTVYSGFVNPRKEAVMIDTSLAGARCRATKEIRSYQGKTGRFTEGTILYNIENFGRYLISVQWDNGVTDYAYPFEIEIIDNEAASEEEEGVSGEKIFWS